LKLCFVIPTRNRAALAIEAIRSLLQQHDTPLAVIVSDNSSREEDVRLLREFCETAGDARLQYIRPPEPLPMGKHWNWALEQALPRTDATHFGTHYDRRITRAGGVAQLAAACARHPESLVVYPSDFVWKSGGRYRAGSVQGRGGDYLIRTSRVVALSAQGFLTEMGQGWPVLANCMVPRAVLERVRARFGTICDSLSPDCGFGFRFCAVEDSYVFLDWPIGIIYAFQYSNAQAYFRGDTSGTFGDFMTFVHGELWPASPIPGLNFGLNAVFHEYVVVQREVEGFPQLEWKGYIRELGYGLQYITDPEQHAAAIAMLKGYGWVEPPPPRFRQARRVARAIITRLGILRQQRRWPAFATEEKGMAYLLANRRRRERRGGLPAILEAVELPS
jgi:glycosyltransferase involved in cell wall biosynthesis